MITPFGHEISRVGPHGYIHNWIFVGVPTVGQEVRHPHHGKGRVVISGTDYDDAGTPHHFVRVLFAKSGDSHKYDVKHEPGAGTFRTREEREAADFAQQRPELEHAVGQFTASAASVAASLIGAPPSFRGTKVVPYKGNEGALAYMGWDGVMGVREDVARHIRDLQAGDTQGHQDDFARSAVTILHELIHSAGENPDDDAHRRASIIAYQGKATADLEEGFTELGAIQHAAEFLRRTGLGGKPTAVLADAHSGKHLTVAGYANRLSQASRIRNGQSWGHYNDQVKNAYSWISQVATLGGGGAAKRQELADEINRAGTGEKWAVLGKQIMREMGITDRDTSAGMLSGLAEINLRNYWSVYGPDKAFKELVPMLREQDKYL